MSGELQQSPRDMFSERELRKNTAVDNWADRNRGAESPKDLSILGLLGN